MTMFEAILCFIVAILTILVVTISQYDLYQEQLNYNLLQQRQADLQQLIKDHPDQWWYKTDLNMTNSFLKMYLKGD